MTGITGGSSSCGVCSMTFDNVGAFRLHAKSPEHVANIRRKAAQSGAEIRDPAGADSDSDGSSSSSSTSSYMSSGEEEEEEEPETTASAGDSKDSSSSPDFVAAQCLFCDARSADADANMVHMASTHSFVVPYQAALVVDVPTLLWYLHLVVYSYHECIACGSRRRSALAAQQHMRSRGHCRFDAGKPEMADFYDVSGLDARLVSELLPRPEEGTIRLASGKLISQRGAGAGAGAAQSSRRTAAAASSNRSTLEQAARSKEEETGTQLEEEGGKEEARDGEGQAVVDRADRKMIVAARQMAQLSEGDRRALAHLAPHEQRRELALRKKQLDGARRAEWRARAALGWKGNRTLMTHYKVQGPERPLG